MKIEYWFLITCFVIIIVAFVIVRLCYISDKKKIDKRALKNKTVFFNNPLQFDDIDFQGDRPTI